MEENTKRIDESWKEEVEKQKQSQQSQESFVPPEPDFKFFLTTLALQASIFLGEMENPTTGKKEKNLPQAKFIIDTLGMLQEKTKGNLNAEEDKLLENLLYELRMQYMRVAK